MPTVNTAEYARQICGSVETVHKLLTERSKSCTCKGFASHLPVEMTPAQLHMVSVIRQQKRVTMTELASLLGVSVASASAMVDRMVKKEILVRKIVPRDRRKVIVRLSPKIDKSFTQIEIALLSPICQLIDQVGPETAGMWCNMLERLKASLVQ